MPGVRDEQSVRAPAEQATTTRRRCGIGGVLNEFDDEAIGVTTDGGVLFGVRVLAEPGRRA